MKTLGDLARKSASFGIPLLMLTLSVAVPVLERADLGNELAAESEHNPATCPTGHDHTVCTQVGANLALASTGQARRIAHAVVTVAAPRQAPLQVSNAVADGHPSRAPPLA
jgi:hypothetical protein